MRLREFEKVDCNIRLNNLLYNGLKTHTPDDDIMKIKTDIKKGEKIVLLRNMYNSHDMEPVLYVTVDEDDLSIYKILSLVTDGMNTPAAKWDELCDNKFKLAQAVYGRVARWYSGYRIPLIQKFENGELMVHELFDIAFCEGFYRDEKYAKYIFMIIGT